MHNIKSLFPGNNIDGQAYGIICK